MTTVERIERARPWLLAECHRIVRHHEAAEDLCGTVMLKAVKSAHTFDDRGSVESWLRRIAQRTRVDDVRKWHRRAQEVPFAPESFIAEDHQLSLADPAPLPDTLPEFIDPRVLRVLAQMRASSPRYYEALIAAVDCESQADAARAAGQTPGSVFRTTLSRARSRARLLLGERQ